jgi:hypothetical protein
MSPAQFALKRPVTIIMVFVSMVAVGLVSARLLPLEYFSALDVPFIGIQVPYQGSTPQEVEREITRPVEEVLATLSGIKRLESTSSSDGAFIEVVFEWGEEVAVKAVEARERVEAIRDQLPADVRRINVFKFNLTDQPVLRLRISSERDLSGAYDLLMRKLVRPLERIEGVARVELQGIEPREVRIELIADRVISHNIDLIDLQRQLQQVNFSDSAGLIRDNDMRYRVNPKGEFRSVEEIGNLVISPKGLRLSDVATIRYDSQKRTYARHLDRKYAIGISVFKENGANLVDVGERALAEVERIGETPEMQGINVFFLDNQAEGVTESLSELLKAGLIGALLSLIVLYFFLGHIQTTLMVSLAVPVAITITLGVMYFLGLSLNILSMMGLMLAVGMLVDNAVVVSERHLDQCGGVSAHYLRGAGRYLDFPDSRGGRHRGLFDGIAVHCADHHSPDGDTPGHTFIGQAESPGWAAQERLCAAPALDPGASLGRRRPGCSGTGFRGHSHVSRDNRHVSAGPDAQAIPQLSPRRSLPAFQDQGISRPHRGISLCAPGRIRNSRRLHLLRRTGLTQQRLGDSVDRRQGLETLLAGNQQPDSGGLAEDRHRPSQLRFRTGWRR